jgi:hypothetical protein
MLIPGGGRLEKIEIITDRAQLHSNRTNENVVRKTNKR